MSAAPLERAGGHPAAVARLDLDPTACTGYGVCAELLPELVHLDEWGYPVLSGREVDAATLGHARRAASSCPRLALRLTRA